VAALALFTWVDVGPVSAATVLNGSFETGNFSGWTVVNQAGGSGGWFVYSGTSSPLSGSVIPGPPEGTYAATTDQRAPGSHVLYQDVALEPGASHSLSFIIYYRNHNRIFNTPETLDYAPEFQLPFGPFNQQYRVDILKPSADPFSVAATDILARVFRTSVGDPATLPPTRKTFDLTPFAGMAVRIRFAEVSNQSFFQAGVDSVKVETSVTACPAGLTPTLTGTAGDDLLAGGPGNDVIFGLSGDDRVFGGGGNDVVCGGAGNDEISGEEGDDQLYGDQGNDTLFGSRGRDKLSAGEGNDRLDGGGEVDQLSGGPGDDRLAAVDGVPGDVVDGGPHIAGDACVFDQQDLPTGCMP
jgi:hypothetical protein